MDKILLLDNYDSFTYNLVHLLYEIGCSEIIVKRNNKIELAEVATFENILLSPGPGIPEEAGIMQQIIQSFSSQKKILGVCLGHQGIAEVFGGRLFNMKEVMHGKQCETRILDSEDALFRGLPTKIETGRYHSWLVERESLPECLKITAESNSGEIMALSHRKWNVKGVQFHPESIMTPEGKKILKNWLEHS